MEGLKEEVEAWPGARFVDYSHHHGFISHENCKAQELDVFD